MALDLGEETAKATQRPDVHSKCLSETLPGPHLGLFVAVGPFSLSRTKLTAIGARSARKVACKL